MEAGTENAVANILESFGNKIEGLKAENLISEMNKTLSNSLIGRI